MEPNFRVAMKIAESEGGEFDDAALTAGYSLGSLDVYLTYMEQGFQYALPGSCIEQADLFAMSHNYASAVVATSEETGWVLMQFMPVSDTFDKGYVGADDASES